MNNAQPDEIQEYLRNYPEATRQEAELSVQLRAAQDAAATDPSLANQLSSAKAQLAVWDHTIGLLATREGWDGRICDHKIGTHYFQDLAGSMEDALRKLIAAVEAVA